MEYLREQFEAALAAAEDAALLVTDRAEMLMEIAIGLQCQPSMEQLASAIQLYDRALALCPRSARLLWARITARRATALQALPGDGALYLEAARESYQQVLPIFAELGSPEELAELEMNHGLVIQALAGMQRARIGDAIGAYQRALRTFDRARHPREVAIIQNNLATAFLSIPFSDDRSKMREALAVQAFEEGLGIVSLVEHPAEYAMLQNNLGNALQYASSHHVVENNLRALEAYDEALKVRTRATMPLEYANTIANKANCLWNLPDDVERPDGGNLRNLCRARAYYGEAREIFAAHGEHEKARAMSRACEQIDRERLAAASHGGNPHARAVIKPADSIEGVLLAATDSACAARSA
jgi:tetratricopeptide (TPR) repeat protein